MTPWQTFASELLAQQDSLRLIADIRRSHARLIARVTGRDTLSGFADLSQTDVSSLIHAGSLPPVARRLHTQAVLQVQSRQKGQPAFSILNADAARIPEPRAADIFFDIEGFPLHPPRGLEYLFGVQEAGSKARADGNFCAWWAHTPAQEERAFILLINYISRRVEGQSGKGTVFHYGQYEVAALRRIASSALSQEGQRAAVSLERMLEDGVFFDVYKFVRSNVVIGESSYSIKKVEKLVDVSREDDQLADAQSSVAMYYEWRRKEFSEASAGDEAECEHSHPILNEILLYNRQDCESLERVVEWLRSNFERAEPGFNPEVRDGGSDKNEDCHTSEFTPGTCGRTPELRKADSDAILRCAELCDELLSSRTTDMNAQASWTLANMLHFYVRESAPDRRMFRERVDLASSGKFDDLYYDEKCIIDAKLTAELDIPGDSKRKLFAYSFRREQPVIVSQGESLAVVVPISRSKRTSGVDEVVGSKISTYATIKAVETDDGRGRARIVVSFGRNANNFVPRSCALISSDELTICDAPLRQSVLRRAEELVREQDCGKAVLAKAFLNRYTLAEDSDPDNDEWVRMFASGNASSERVSEFLSTRKTSRVFVIQGPPGTGKTSLSGRLIADLITKYGKTVAVTSNSHAAIDNLLDSAVRAGAGNDNVCKVGTRKNGQTSVRFKANIRDLSVEAVKQSSGNVVSESARGGRSNPKAQRKNNKVALVGATCYQLCREENEGKFDLLFIDEASQVPMAHLVAVAACAKYAVLVGDQQQLEMPIKGCHFGGVGQSCLSYSVGEGVATVEAARGIFLGRSYRMNPKICEFVSEAFYDNALVADEACASNHVAVGDLTDESVETFGEGIRFVNVGTAEDDDICAQKSEVEVVRRFGKWCRPREVTAIAQIIRNMLGTSFTVRNRQGKLETKDFLVVAPYNAQVRALREELPAGVRVGTVDKFQGQEAAVALVSTCTSRVRAEDEDEDGDDKWNMDERGVNFGEADAREHKGLRFCLQRNRLNVAISRAQCVAVVVGDEDGCARLPLRQMDDISTAALFEHLMSFSAPLNVSAAHFRAPV